MIAIAPKHMFRSFYSTTTAIPNELIEICRLVSSDVGGLDDMESTLNRLPLSLTSPLVTQIIHLCKHQAPPRRLLRFFSWSHSKLKSTLTDDDFNHAIRAVAQKKDYTAIQILLSDFSKEGNRVLEMQTYTLVIQIMVKLGKEDDALGIFKNLERFNFPQSSASVSALVHALCAKGYAKRAQGVVYHHKDKISGEAAFGIYKSLLYGWCMQENVKEARKLIQEIKSKGFVLDLFCFNTYLKCLCQQNLKKNPSGLVPETLNVMMEMRSYKIFPNSVSYNILLSCLCRARRVKESCMILEKMKKEGCGEDWVSYYLVVRVLYLTGRFGKGNQIVDEMIQEGVVADHKFYYNLIGLLCAHERVNHAVELFQKMKRSSSLGGYGPIYQLLIPKLCPDKGRELCEEAMASDPRQESGGGSEGAKSDTSYKAWLYHPTQSDLKRFWQLNCVNSFGNKSFRLSNVQFVPENKRRVSTLKVTVIARRNAGLNSTFRLRRMVARVGIESLFPLGGL